MRPDPYALADYLQDFDKWKTALIPLFPQRHALGCAFVGNDRLSNPDVANFVDREAGSVGILSLHFYAGSPYWKSAG